MKTSQSGAVPLVFAFEFCKIYCAPASVQVPVADVIPPFL